MSFVLENIMKSKNALKLQDEQIILFNKAEELSNIGKIDEALEILEDIMFNKKLIIRGEKWPYILSKMYLKNNMYDKCWKYLNFLYVELPETKIKVRDLQATILKKEKKYLDALRMKMSFYLLNYTSVDYKPDYSKIEKDLKTLIKNAGFENIEHEILSIFHSYLSNRKFSESKFVKDFNNLVKN